MQCRTVFWGKGFCVCQLETLAQPWAQIPFLMPRHALMRMLPVQVTYADVGYHDMGNRMRRYFGIGGFQNVTIETVDSSRRRHSSQRRMLSAAL